MQRWILLATSALTLLASLPSPAVQAQSPAAGAEFFESKIRPLLSDNCFKCHSAAKQKGGLRLESRAAMLEGGDRGPAIVPGQPAKSLLLQAVAQAGDLKMPPSKRLSRQQIADLTHWIQLGAPWPNAGSGPAASVRRGGFALTDRDRNHWAFQPVHRPALPRVEHRNWLANPIDTFILAGLEARGLQPNPPASRRALIRRIYYDLLGIPPTPAEVEAFVTDLSPDAYPRLVDRLLASPGYGEKWGRHWLDLVRFAETNSYERDDPKPLAWRYRDHVLRSFNLDKPYDRFLREQLAGDEFPNPDADALIATGYYRMGIWDDEPTDALQARYDGLDDILATTGQVVLGLTVDCARCHDHKIDPIPQQDYYRLLAFFHNINPYRNGGPTDLVPLLADAPMRLAREQQRSRRARAQTGVALGVTEVGNRAPDTYVLLRGNPRVHGDRVEPGFPVVLGGASPSLPTPPSSAKTTGRRLVLANWLASPENPLTARVMANRVWQYHFGRGLSRSPNNFGLQGDKPTHPELLDWLAGELVAQGWRLKPLHRLILLSNAYQMSSRNEARALAADINNDLFWRFDMRRLTAEELRDSLLAVNGTLLRTMFGPSVYVTIPQEVLAGQSVPGSGWGNSPPKDQARRSVYIHVKRSLLTPILETFDLAETDRSTPVRFVTTQPTQALGMLNSSFVQEQASLFAARLCREAGTQPEQQVRLALALALARPATTEEVRRDVQLLEELRKKDGIDNQKALAYYCLMVLNLNEFIYLD
jgi:mono/diheme cytochrome c family protein